MSKLLHRRNLLKYGAAGVAGLGLHRLVNGMDAFSPPASNAYPGYIKEPLGRYIYLTPQKLGGGTHAVDLEVGKTLAWISYWNYGDSCPISHHVAAFPPDHGDPYKVEELKWSRSCTV